MLQSKIGRNFLIFFFLLNLIVVGSFVFAILKRPDVLHAFPGQYGPALSPDLSGNMLFLALLLLMNAMLFVTFGLGGTWHALWAGLRISPRKLRWLLHDRSGLASDISGVVAQAVQEEEKSELGYLGIARGLLFVGLLLLIAALPAVCITYAKAAPGGAAMFETGGAVVANSAVSQDAVLRFTGDQLAGGLLLDVPEIFHLRATVMETNSANILFAIFVLLYRTLVGFGLLVWFIASRRMGSLRSAALEVAIAASEIVAIDQALQDGHGHSDHDDHHHEEHRGHDDHGHSDHGHSDHGHDDHGHGDHGHDDHGHGDHGRGDHGHSDHGYDNHGHSDHGDDSHGHDDHGHHEKAAHHEDHGHADHHAATDDAHDDDGTAEHEDDSESSDHAAHEGDAHGHHDSHGHDNHSHAEDSHGHGTHHHATPSDPRAPAHKAVETV